MDKGKYIALGISVVAGCFMLYKKYSTEPTPKPEVLSTPQLIKAMNFATQQ